MKLLISGINGRLGRTLLQGAKEKEFISDIIGYDKFYNENTLDGTVVYKNLSDISEKIDLIIDFSRADSIKDLLDYAIKNNISIVIATTGHNSEQLELIEKASKKTAVFKSTNMSLGVNLLIDLAKKAASVLSNYDIEIIEQHHNIKVDSPSGTAVTIADEINSVFNNSKKLIYGRHSNNQRRQKDEICTHAVRGGSVIGKHEVLFLGEDEFITLKHEAQSKAIFTQGALAAAKFLHGKKPGYYDMNSLINSL